MEQAKSTLNNITNIGKNQSIISTISEKMPELPSNPLEKSNTEKMMDKFSFSSKPSLSLNSTYQNVPSGTSMGWGFRIFLLFFILILLIVNAWTYLEKGKDIFSENLRNSFLNSSNGVFGAMELSFDNLVKGTRFSKGILADSVKSVINLIRTMLTTKLSTGEKAMIKQDDTKSQISKEINSKKKKKKQPTADESESSIQTSKKGNVCYIGHQSPHNACIQMNDVKKCMSGKIFKTIKECQGYKPIVSENET